jgi:hypothetical protein
VRIGDAALELVLRQRLLLIVDVRVARRFELGHGAAADAFEQQYLDVLLRE